MRQRPPIDPVCWLARLGAATVVLAGLSRLCSGAELVTTTTQASGTDWTAPIWTANGAASGVSPHAGDTCECMFNGTPFGNGLNNTRIRNPAIAGVNSFPGDSLTLNTNTELRMKQAGAILDFPGAGGNPGLIINGGVLNPGDDTVFTVTGKIQVRSTSFICPADVGGGAVKPLRGVNLAGQLSGPGTLVIFQAGTDVPQQISGSSNAFFGRWILKAGWLLGTATGSLGTNSILVDPNYNLNLDPGISPAAGPAVLELGYDLVSAGSLSLGNGGMMKLHQNCTFTTVTVENVPLSPGTYSHAELAARFPGNFPAGGFGSITVQANGTSSPPAIFIQPVSFVAFSGVSAQLYAGVTGTMPMQYQWQKGTNGLFSDLADSATVSGAGSNVLSFTPLTVPDAGDYRLMVTNGVGAATSSVARIEVLTNTTTDGGALTGAVSEVHFSVERGFYEQPFTLALTVDAPGTVIRYTTDGSPPTGTSGMSYTNPLAISHTTILRAADFGTNGTASAVRTHTYIFLENTLQQPANPPGFPATTQWSDYGWPSDYEMDSSIVTNPFYAATLKADLQSLPALSLVLRTDDMFGVEHGLYTHPHDLTNEARCSVELINADRGAGFQCDAGLKMHGGGSRLRTLKHPMRLSFKSEYGPAKLKYQFFPDSPVDEFDTIVLRSDYNNHWTHGFDATQRARGGLVRDIFFKDLQLAMGGLSSHGRYVHLYINGLYWGVYNPCERPDASFAAAYLGGNKTNYDAINGTDAQLTDGDMVARNTMLSLDTSGLADLTQYAQIQQYVDIPQFIDYMIVQLYGGNWDWGAQKNWYAVRRREPGAGFKYLCWDSERTMEGANDWVNVSPDNLQANLALNPEYRLAFADRIQKHFFNGGALTPNAVSVNWLNRSAQIDRAIVGESARWGDSVPNGKVPLSPLPYPSYTAYTPYTREENWIGEQDRLLTSYFPVRSGFVLEQFISAGLYPSVTAPSFNQHGGRVAMGFMLTMSSDNEPIYYTTDGSDPRVYGIGTPALSARPYSQPLPLAGSVLVKARTLSAGVWSALSAVEFFVIDATPQVQLNEVMAANLDAVPNAGTYPDWVELRNTSSNAVGLTDWSLSDSGDPRKYVFPADSFIPLGGYLVVWCDSQSGNPGLHSGFKLDRTGESLSLYDETTNRIDAFSFGLQLDNYTVGRVGPEQTWQLTLPSPGAENIVAALGSASNLVLNEWLANSTPGNPDWIELYNRSASLPVSLTGLYLATSNAVFQISSLSFVPPNGFVQLFADKNPGPDHLDFKLSAKGDALALYDSAFNPIDAVVIAALGEGISEGRVPDGSANIALCAPTPGASNRLWDTDADGLPDDWEVANQLNPQSGTGDDGANGDVDHDGYTNLQEFLAGTDPRDPLSCLCLRIEAMPSSSGGVILRFTRVADHTYTLQYVDDLSTGAWQKLADFDSTPTNSVTVINDSYGLGTIQRFYRLVTPKTP